MNDLIIADTKLIDNTPVRHLTIIGDLNLTSLKYALQKARNAYLDILSEPDITEPERNAFSNEINIIDSFIDKLKFLDHELHGINVQRTEKTANS